MVAQLLCVQSFLFVWKEDVTNQMFIEFCIFYITHWYIMFCGLQPAKRTHNPQLHTIPTT